jgi:hypothetical protein
MYYKPLSVFTILYMIVYSLTLGPLLWVYLAEIQNLKGFSFSVIINWSVIFIVNLFGVVGNYDYFFFVFSIMTLLVHYYLVYYIPWNLLP